MNKTIPIITLLMVAILLNILMGSVWIPMSDVINIVMGNGHQNKAWESVILNHRVPRVITAVLAGSGLSLSGLYMQTFFRNPLAGPYVLGISAGASLGIALVVLGGGFFASAGLIILSNVSLTLAAVVGSALVFLVVIYFSNKVSDPMSLLIIGLMFSSATSAFVSVLQYFGKADNIQEYLFWTFGDISGVSYDDLLLFAPLIIIGLLGSMLIVKPLNIYLVGDQYANNAGLNLKKSRYAIISVTALLAGSVTAYCGPIAFIGLAIPHITRMVLDSADHRKLIPYSALLGAAVLLLCDLISRLPGLPQTLPLNAITSIFGGPLVIWLIVKKKNLQNSF